MGSRAVRTIAQGNGVKILPYSPGPREATPALRAGRRVRAGDPRHAEPLQLFSSLIVGGRSAGPSISEASRSVVPPAATSGCRCPKAAAGGRVGATVNPPRRGRLRVGTCRPCPMCPVCLVGLQGRRGPWARSDLCAFCGAGILAALNKRRRRDRDPFWRVRTRPRLTRKGELPVLKVLGPGAFSGPGGWFIRRVALPVRPFHGVGMYHIGRGKRNAIRTDGHVRRYAGEATGEAGGT